MTAEWNLTVLVPAVHAAEAAAIARGVWPDAPGDGQQLTVELVSEGGEAWLCGTATVTDAEIAALQGLADIDRLIYFRWTLDGVLAQASIDGPEAGSAWGWQACVDVAGLILIKGVYEE